MAHANDAELHMLAYWVDDKGIETAFADYYPNLAQNDEVIRAALTTYRVAKLALMGRVAEIVANAEEGAN
jgi:hypothetical protein